MKKLLLFLLVTIIVLTGCKPKVDPIEVDYITVKVYWASTCPYCLKQLVVVDEICRELIGHPYLEGKVEIVAANVNLTSEELFEMMQEAEEFPFFLRITTGSHLPQWSNGLPTIVVKDTFGEIRFQHIGFANKAQLYHMIMETLGFTETI